MLALVLSYIHNALTMLFGVFLSTAFVGVSFSRKNLFALSLFSFGLGAVFVGSFLLFGEDVTEKIYPLIIHLPLILFLTLFFKQKFPVSVLSVLTAYLSCQLSNWVGVAVLECSNSQAAYFVTRIAVTVATFVLLMCFVCETVSHILQKPTRSLMVFSMIPFVYYAYDYITAVYTDILYSGRGVVVEFLGFVLCIAYILFLLIYFRQYEEKCESQRRTQFMELQQTHTKKSFEAIRRCEKLMAITRHDMRHFLSNVSTLIENGDNQKALEYIESVTETVDRTALKKYCLNETVNMIISSYESDFQNFDIKFSHSIALPENLSVSDVELTAILSNALENAVKAVSLRQNDRRIEFEMRMNGEKLLISVKNTFSEQPIFCDGLPTATKEGHGFGVQSIRLATEKLHGQCQFSLENDLFVLRIIL